MLQVRSRILLGLLCSGVCGCLGCNTNGNHAPDVALASAVRDPVIQDIPKPQGFTLVTDRSMTVQSGKYRLVKCEYVGPTAAIAVKRFYEEYMPSARFELRQWSLDSGVFTLNYESAGELCTIRIRDRGAKTVIGIEIVPKPTGPVQRDQPQLRRRT